MRASTSHRLPTFSASQALEEIQNSSSSAVPSGLASLDRALAGNNQSTSGGFDRGKIAEIWGPSGAGKTAIALQAVEETIKSRENVVWIDAAVPLHARTESTRNISDSPHVFQYFYTHSLSHLLALIVHPPSSFPPEKTSLLVIDGINILIDLDYPRFQFSQSTKTEPQKWHAGRRYAILGNIVGALNKLAVIHNMAIIVMTGCSTRMRTDYGLGASLAPGVGGAEWEVGIWSRIIVFRDFHGRFLGVQKFQGRNLTPLDPVGGVGCVVGFDLTENGMPYERRINSSPGGQGLDNAPAEQPTILSSPVKSSLKRAYQEIADSDDEAGDEYPWEEADEAAIAAEGLVEDHSPGNVDPPPG